MDYCEAIQEKNVKRTNFAQTLSKYLSNKRLEQKKNRNLQ